MKTCKDCNISYEDDKKFCKKCGSPLIQEYNIDPRELAKKNVYEERLKTDPLNIDILHEYAQFLFNNLLFKNAVSTLLKILAINESDEFAKELLFGSYLKLKMYREAQELGEQLLENRTTDIILIEGLAEIELQLGNKAKAYEYYETILKLQPANPKALYHKAIGMLENNEIENATDILKEKYAEGNRDRIASIYAGIDQCLSDNHKKAVEILETCLSGNEIALSDVHNQQGFLCLVYSLCKTQHPIGIIDEWFSLLDFDLIKSFQQPIDEENLAKAISEITNIYFDGLHEITSDKIQNAIKKYIDKSIICSTEFAHNYYAETWRKIAEIQESLGLLKDAQSSLKKAIERNPNNADYKEKLNEITALHEKHKKRQKRKVLTIASSLIALVVVVVVSVNLFNRHNESKAWETAKQLNTYESYGDYLRKYPADRFSAEAVQLKEEVLWQVAKELNTVEAYDDYLGKYPNGKYLDEAFWNISKSINNVRGFLSYITHSNSKKYLSIAKSELKDRDYLVNFSLGVSSNSYITIEKIQINEKETIISLISSQGGILHAPNHYYAYIIRDKLSSSTFRIKSSDLEFEENIPINKSFNLYFDKLPENIKYFDLIEGTCNSGCWNFYNIKIEPAEFEEQLYYQVGNQSRGLISIVNIANSLNNTVVSIKKENSGGIILPPNHNEAFYIKDDFTNKKYNLLGSSIGFNQSIVKNEVFDLIFEKIDNDTKQISVIEGDLPSNTGWHFTEIKLER